jgi:hypothetical protein
MPLPYRKATTAKTVTIGKPGDNQLPNVPVRLGWTPDETARVKQAEKTAGRKSLNKKVREIATVLASKNGHNPHEIAQILFDRDDQEIMGLLVTEAAEDYEELQRLREEAADQVNAAYVEVIARTKPADKDEGWDPKQYKCEDYFDLPADLKIAIVWFAQLEKMGGTSKYIKEYEGESVFYLTEAEIDQLTEGKKKKGADETAKKTLAKSK